MTPADIIDRYHRAVRNLIWQGDISRETVAFREGHDIDPDSPVGRAMTELYHAHLRRVAGTGSPQSCDDICNQLKKGDANGQKPAATELTWKKGGAGLPVSSQTEDE